uniref:Uncharacterized protein n=1 Tax=Rhizophora mucronata TaxID=61149 RepID=A0A2P2K3F3_RHIMU
MMNFLFPNESSVNIYDFATSTVDNCSGIDLL